MTRLSLSRRSLLRRSVTAAPGSALALGLATGESEGRAPPPEAWTLEIESFDGEVLAYRAIGVGRPLLLLHGFLSNAQQTWMASGLADRLATSRRRVILPDFRGHGRSAKPQDPARYPADVLAMDIETLLAQMEITDCDVAGYSLGARIAARLVVRGLRPRKLALCGMGYEGLTAIAARQAYFENLIMNGEASGNPRAARVVAAMMEQTGISRDAALFVLRSQRDVTREELSLFESETRIVCGTLDRDNGDPASLAAAIPGAVLEQPEGDHLTTVSAPAFADALVRFFGEAAA